jgi:hypothetical protein
MSKTDPETISWLLSLANDMRSAKGDNLLDKLPKSIPSDAHSCVIANAFNYNCEVSPGKIFKTPDGEFVGAISFENSKDRDIYLKIVGISKESLPDYDGGHADFTDDVAPLTPELNEIAHKFDAGLLFRELVPEGYRVRFGVMDNKPIF